MSLRGLGLFLLVASIYCLLIFQIRLSDPDSLSQRQHNGADLRRNGTAASSGFRTPALAGFFVSHHQVQRPSAPTPTPIRCKPGLLVIDLTGTPTPIPAPAPTVNPTPAPGPAPAPAPTLTPTALKSGKPDPVVPRHQVANISRSEDNRPNIILLLGDDVRADMLGCYGGPRVTPHLDRLASKSVVFDRVYIMGSTRIGVCAPARAMLLTGRSLWHAMTEASSGVVSGSYPVGAVGLGQALKNENYTTYGVGKFHASQAMWDKNFDSGKAFLLGAMGPHFVDSKRKLKLRDKNEMGGMTLPSETISKCSEREGNYRECHSTEIFTRVALEFLELQEELGVSRIENETQHRRPFFLQVGFTAPHDPWAYPEGFGVPEHVANFSFNNFAAAHPFEIEGVQLVNDEGQGMGVRDELIVPPPRTRRNVTDLRIKYLSLLHHLDFSIGRILDKVSHLKNTVIVFTADHGVALGSHGLISKQNLYEHSVRIPLSVYGLAVTPTRVTSPILAQDLPRTLAELAGTELPPDPSSQFRTFSFLSLLQNPGDYHRAPTSRRFVFLAFMSTVRAIIDLDSGLKLITYFSGQGKRNSHVQLFNITADPFEEHDLTKVARAESSTVKLQDQILRLAKEACRLEVAYRKNAKDYERHEKCSCTDLQPLPLQIRTTMPSHFKPTPRPTIPSMTPRPTPMPTSRPSPLPTLVPSPIPTTALPSPFPSPVGPEISSSVPTAQPSPRPTPLPSGGEI